MSETGATATGDQDASNQTAQDMQDGSSVPSPQNDRNGRLTAIGLMAPAIVHDFGNLLQSVASVLNMVDRRIDAGRIAELKALTADGLRAIDRAAALSKRLMAYGRPRPSMKSRVDVNALLRDLLPLLRLATGHGITVELSLADGALEIWCDPQDLENAVMNLAINARDAMPGGGAFVLQTFKAELTIDHASLARGDYVIVAASDTGAGMAAEVASRAFDPYFSTKAAGEGFGMGLATVRAFVGAAGGGADIASSPGKGTTVRLYLPQIQRRA
ncbi:MAG: ATP-binding protein [Rhizomicrobium sp.]